MSGEKKTSEIVEEIIRNYVGDFEKGDIFLELKRQTRREATAPVLRIIGEVINKLRQRNPPEIIEVEKGKGRRSGSYRMRTS
jgi:hypothetical protein